MPFPKLQVIRRSSFTATPWKNGGGITHEAIRVPATGDPFRWRISVAHIDASGPFSDFAGYNRKMMLLKGAGIELRFADGARRRVGPERFIIGSPVIVTGQAKASRGPEDQKSWREKEPSWPPARFRTKNCMRRGAEKLG